MDSSDHNPNEPTEVEQVTPVPVEKKPTVDWWNRYVVPSAVGFLVLIALYWLVTTYVIPSAK
jgi:hypothetical protein